jgi:hypothetical protein
MSVEYTSNTDWAAFVDDDDTLGDTFVSSLVEEAILNPLANAVP